MHPYGSLFTLGAARMSALHFVKAQSVLFFLPTFKYTYSLHCSSFSGLPFRILNIELVKPKKGTTMETIGSYSGRMCTSPKLCMQARNPAQAS